MIEKGTLIGSRYKIIKSIGEGGMANVYLAEDIVLKREVALKMLRGELSNQDKFLKRFQKEALALSASSSSHPNIVDMYDVGEDKDYHYIVMEYIEGETLKKLLTRRGHLTLTEVVDISLQLTSGVAHAHNSYIIHRDLKPQNIMIQKDGLVKITDFGIATASNQASLTLTNSIMGSVHYLPPEQASGKPATIKSDIYSLGIIMYEMLTGELPFNGDSAVEIALKHMKEPLPSIRKRNPKVPVALENIVIKATAKNPKNRYDNVNEMVKDLKSALDPSRKDEAKISFKYPEFGFEEEPKLMIGEPKDKKTIKEEVVSKSDDDVIKEEVKEETNEDDKGAKKDKILFRLVVGTVSFIILSIIIAMIVPKFIKKTKEVKIPDVTKMTMDDAKGVLENKGFVVSVSEHGIKNDKIEKGLTFKTDPPAGTKIKYGRKVTIFLSEGDDKIEILDYKGKDVNEVNQELSKLGLRVSILKENIDEGEVDNKIIKQEPEAGKKVSPGSEIKLYIYEKGETYPDFVSQKWKIEEVREFAKKYDLKLTEDAVDSTENEGLILSQNRMAGVPIIKGATLIVRYAKKSK